MELSRLPSAWRLVVWSLVISSAPQAVAIASPPSASKSVGVKQIAETILLYQRDTGGWPKNYDRDEQLSDEKRRAIVTARANTDATIDNGATHTEIRLLTAAYQQMRDERFEKAILRGVNYLLQSQYQNGGWPQCFPNARGYSKHITFNDNAMIGVMRLLRDIARDRERFSFVPPDTRRKCAQAVARGIDCILKCQISVEGTPAVWCAQQDEITFEPRRARSYELPSLSGSESVGIVRFLMEIEDPSEAIVQAIEAAVDWFERSKLEEIKLIRVEDETLPKGFDKVVVVDPSAPPMWARFYDIKTNSPIYCSRDGIPRMTLAEISHERRNGYSWLGYYAHDLLVNELPAWRKRMKRVSVIATSPDEKRIVRFDIEPYRLQLKAPIKTWDEAIPLGNGLTGGLLWGSGSAINLSLDRGDLWDERLPQIYHGDNWDYDTIQKLKASGNQAEISRLFDHPYNRVRYPTKLPGGRLVLQLAEAQQAESFELDMRRAVGRVALGAGQLECFFSATQPVAMLRLPGPALTYRFVRPGGLDKLGYEAAESGEAEGMMWMVQEAAMGLTYAVVVASKRVGDETQLAVAITTNRTGQDPLALGKQRVRAALDAGFDTLLEPHLKWWNDFWSMSSVRIPDSRLRRHYNLVKYFYGAASRPDAPPIPLQGVWTRDDGDLPPWKGDFHHDLNTQMTYLPYHTAGLVDAGLSFINHNWQLLPTYRTFARDFYGVEGAAIPGAATLAGKPTAGWSQYALSATNGLWVGQSFYLHWRYTMDREFLETRAYPWLSEVATGVINLLEQNHGKLYLPLSSSPEIHDNSLRAWLEPNSNYDLSLMHWALDALAEMAEELGKADDARRWRQLRGKLDDLLVDEENVLMFAEGEPFNVSHRHHSHTMAIHPLATLHLEGSDRDRAIINATLDSILAKGTQAWTGYSFSWFSCMLARAGRAEEALQYLKDYERAFTLRNGFHVNGDQIGAGLSRFRYRPFTLEGNFLAMEAVHDMLLQSWGGRLRVFPAVSEKWADVSFNNLRAQGGFCVSAERKAGKTVRVKITAAVDGPLRLKNPFGDHDFQSSYPYDVSGDQISCTLKAGQSMELHTVH